MANNHAPFLDPSESTHELLTDWNLSETINHPESVQEIATRQLTQGGSRNLADPVILNRQISTRSRVAAGIEKGIQPDSALIGAFDIASSLPETKEKEGLIFDPGKSGTSQDTLGSTIQRPEIEVGLDQCRSKPRFPGLGESLSGFRIIKELGRGSFARVYLAEESNLGNRLVAIKVSEAVGDEPQVLAKLLHTHIVPVHSVHTDKCTGLRILCMPYFGGANLAEVLQSEVFSSNSSMKRSGSSLIQALDRISSQPPCSSRAKLERTNVKVKAHLNSTHRCDDKSPALFAPASNSASHISYGVWSPYSSILGRKLGKRLHRLRWDSPRDSVFCVAGVSDSEVDQPSRRFLRGASGIQAAVWIIARLAEGLGHAHAKGLLHRDIKPSNVLIAADGTPMLLDFNLSVEQASVLSDNSLSKQTIGGTLPYMSPEHLDAFYPRGTTAPPSVDSRSDIYALGIILFEMIAGHHPFPVPEPQKSLLETIRAMQLSRRTVPSLRAARPDVPWSIDALAGKCLDPEPRRRYQFAEELAEDLRRFLDDLPMKYSPEPSSKERLQKWARRHPTLSSSTSVAVFGLILVLILGASIDLLYSQIQDVSARLRLQVFRQNFADAQFWLNTQSDSIEHLKKGLTRSKQSLQDLGLLNSSNASCTGWVGKLPLEERGQTGDQAVELSLLHAHAVVKLAEKLGNEKDRRIALEGAVQLLDRVLLLSLKPTSALFLERARYEDALGLADAATADRRKASEIPPSSTHDNLILGNLLLADGKAVQAETPLKVAIGRDVTSFWAWFSLGHCYFQQGRFSDAVAAFTACVVRGPKFAWAHFNLGLALAKSGRLEDAKTSYTRALELDPTIMETRINRGLVELELNQLEQARVDLEKGIADGQDAPAILAAYGETLARLGRQDEAERYFTKLLDNNPDSPDIFVAMGMTRLRSNPDRASQDFKAALRLAPEYPTAHYGLARVLRNKDPARALAHLDCALRVNPNLIDAIQLRALIRARNAEPGTLDDVEKLLEKPSSYGLYNAACALAVYSESTKDARWVRRSLELLSRAISMGFPVREAVMDPDLKILRAHPEYNALITGPRS